MTSLPVEVLLGIYLGLLTGIVPALVAGTLGFLVRYVTGVSLPGFGVVVLALSIASVQGGLLGLVEPTITQSPRLLVAVLVVLMLALYAHSQGDRLGGELPRRVSLTEIRRRTLSADVVETVGGIGQVTVRPLGEIRDVEGYPPLPSALRASIREDSWRLPADLPLSELEVRLAERLRTAYDLADVSVSIDERGRATIAAAPPSGGLSRRISGGYRAVSLETLVPTGLASGDEVTVRADVGTIDGTVLSAHGAADEPTAAPPVEPVEAAPESDHPAVRSATGANASDGGAGRLTIVVPDGDVERLLEAGIDRVVVQSRGTSPELRALSLLKRGGRSVRRLTVGDGAAVDASDGVTVLARRRRDAADGSSPEWAFGRDVEAGLEAGDELVVAGRPTALEAAAERWGR
ncbi:potassium transporter TrkA [Natrononativus amylolyticus]|uniref:potassium transporter TrkA n=1 Tax=Natrononativus amylolyticus TaxID=2963434 RepID=UPI0020CC3A4C|nr:potassium transporter TrkA [Natrononativus amylolyticus]